MPTSRHDITSSQPINTRRIDQTHIMDMFNCYLELVFALNPKAKKKDVENYKFKIGHCYGFTITHNSLALVGKLKWLEESLNAISDFFSKNLIDIDKKLEQDTELRKLKKKAKYSKAL